MVNSKCQLPIKIACHRCFWKATCKYSNARFYAGWCHLCNYMVSLDSKQKTEAVLMEHHAKCHKGKKMDIRFRQVSQNDYALHQHDKDSPKFWTIWRNRKKMEVAING